MTGYWFRAYCHPEVYHFHGFGLSSSWWRVAWRVWSHFRTVWNHFHGSGRWGGSRSVNGSLPLCCGTCRTTPGPRRRTPASRRRRSSSRTAASRPAPSLGLRPSIRMGVGRVLWRKGHPPRLGWSGDPVAARCPFLGPKAVPPAETGHAVMINAGSNCFQVSGSRIAVSSQP